MLNCVRVLRPTLCSLIFSLREAEKGIEREREKARAGGRLGDSDREFGWDKREFGASMEEGWTFQKGLRTIMDYRVSQLCCHWQESTVATNSIYLRANNNAVNKRNMIDFYSLESVSPCCSGPWHCEFVQQ